MAISRPRVEFGQVHAVVEDGAAVNKAVGVQQAHGALDEHGFAGAGLAHDGEALALMHIQRNAPDGVEHLAPQGEFHVQIPNGEDHILFIHSNSLLS